MALILLLSFVVCAGLLFSYTVNLFHLTVFSVLFKVLLFRIPLAHSTLLLIASFSQFFASFILFVEQFLCLFIP